MHTRNQLMEIPSLKTLALKFRWAREFQIRQTFSQVPITYLFKTGKPIRKNIKGCTRTKIRLFYQILELTIVRSVNSFNIKSRSLSRREKLSLGRKRKRSFKIPLLHNSQQTNLDPLSISECKMDLTAIRVKEFLLENNHPVIDV